MPMTGFEPLTSHVGSDSSISWATTTALKFWLCFNVCICNGQLGNQSCWDFMCLLDRHPCYFVAKNAAIRSSQKCKLWLYLKWETWVLSSVTRCNTIFPKDALKVVSDCSFYLTSALFKYITRSCKEFGLNL